MERIPQPELATLHKRLTDDDLRELLAMRGTLLRESMAYDLIRQMAQCLKPITDGPGSGGVPIVHKGEVVGYTRPTPGELFRLQQAIAGFDPNEFGSVLKPNRNEERIGENLMADPNINPETLRKVLGKAAATDDE